MLCARMHLLNVNEPSNWCAPGFCIILKGVLTEIRLKNTVLYYIALHYIIHCKSKKSNFFRFCAAYSKQKLARYYLTQYTK